MDSFDDCVREVTAAYAAARGQLAARGARVAELEAATDGLRADLARERDGAEMLRDELEAAAERIAALEAATEAAAALNAALERERSRTNDLSGQLDTARTDIAALENELADVADDRARERARADVAEARERRAGECLDAMLPDVLASAKKMDEFFEGRKRARTGE